MLRYRHAARRGRRRALPVADGAAARRAPAARAAARSCSPRTTCCRASRAPASCAPSAACTSAWTRSSSTPSTAASACRRARRRPRSASTSSPTARSRRARRGPPSAAAELPAPPRRRRSSSSSACCAPTRASTSCCEAWEGIERRRAVDRRACRAWTSAPAARAAPRRASASSRASSRRPSRPRLFARADLVVLPYREIDQSGVAFTALGTGTPLLASAVGGFPELAAPARRAWSRPATPRPCAPRCARCWPTPAAARRWPRAPAPPPPGRTPGTRSRAARWPCTSRCERAVTNTARTGRRARRSATMAADARALEIFFWLSAALIVWTQLGYALALARARPRARAAPRPRPRPRRAPDAAAARRSVSLIVAAHDERDGDRATRSPTLLALDYPRERLSDRRAATAATTPRRAALARPAPTSCSSCPRGGKIRAQDAGVRARARARSSPSRTPTRCGSPTRCTRLVERLRRPARRLRLRPGPLRAGGERRGGHQPGGRLLAL